LKQNKEIEVTFKENNLRFEKEEQLWKHFPGPQVALPACFRPQLSLAVEYQMVHPIHFLLFELGVHSHLQKCFLGQMC
jgi:hypothetical protein